MKKWILMLLLVGVVSSSFLITAPNEGPVPIPKTQQRVGDAKKGYDYLVTGDYIKGGIPYKMFVLAYGSGKKYLQRSGDNEKIPDDFTAVQASNGEIVVAPNCLQCHAQVFEDKLVIGLGNSLADFTKGAKLNPKNYEMAEAFLKLHPKQYDAAALFLKVSKTITPYITVETRGVNTADRLAAALVAHRDPVTFEWSDKPLLELSDEVIPTDTPAWWLLKKKNAMFYNGFGRGDFGRFLMASNLLTVKDSSESARVNEHMPDVLAYLFSLQPPKYPRTLDQALVKQGQRIFEADCASCHGTYGEKGSYPNLLIPESMIGTDSSLYKSNYSEEQFVNWFNSSWFTKGANPAMLVPFAGYIAPPLDGVWVTAPYFHNGSVPTIEAVLNSKLRPQYWSRNFEHPEYDYEKLGWKYQVEPKPGGSSVYNTTLRGYGNYGHYFGDALTDSERKAVIEYLKTL